MEHHTFAEWWEPFVLGVGPAGAYLESADSDRQAAVRARCLAILGPGPFTIQARVWAREGTSVAVSARCEWGDIVLR